MLLHPQIFQHYDYGVSAFGSVPVTSIPYYFGFGITIFLTALTARRLQSANRPLSVFFFAFAACMMGVAITSYSASDAVYAVHYGFVIALTICILAAIGWLVKQGGLTWLDYILMGLIIVTVVVSALPIVHSIPGVRVYIPRELTIFVCSLWLLGRSALKASAAR